MKRLNYVRVADSIRIARETSDVTQAQVADALGISTGAVSMIESGYIKKPDYLIWYILTFDIGPDEMKGWWEEWEDFDG